MTKQIVRPKLSSPPPIPTKTNPHAQVDWIWEKYMRRYKNEKTVLAMKKYLAAYKRFLKEVHGYDERLKEDPRLYLEVHWDLFAIYNAENFWRNSGYGSHYIIGGTGLLKNIIDFAVAEDIIPPANFIYRKVKGERETNQRDAYTDEEIYCIRKLIRQEIQYPERIVAGYQRTGIGEDPRESSPSKSRTSKWKCWENIVWYFENVLQCKAISSKQHVNSQEIRGITTFFKALSIYHGRVGTVWKRLGVAPVVEGYFIAPFVMKLALETGLNPEAILNLKRDCYQECHDLTRLPYLKYYKERSTGEKILHLGLLDDENLANLHLFPKQSEVIKQTIETILRLTEPLVEDARDEDKDYLLLFQNQSFKDSPRSGKNSVMRFKSHLLGAWSAKMRKQIQESDTGETLDVLNMIKFRATKITQMVRDGHDFFRIQAVAGHASALTTARYISSFAIEPRAQREIAATLIQIHRNSKEQELNPKPFANAETQHREGTIYKGVMCDCKNVYAPPKAVRNLELYREGQACTYWNMCLFCPNIIISRRHLPLLIRYANEITSSFKNSNLIQVPNAALYQKALDVIEGVLQEVPEEVLKWAREIAENSDYYTDGVVYRGINCDE